MRWILIDEARRKQAGKRGAKAQRVSLDDVDSGYTPQDDELLAIDEALTLLTEKARRPQGRSDVSYLRRDQRPP